MAFTANPREHGSMRGYRQHKRATPKEEPCRACLDAKAAYERAYWGEAS